MRATHAICVGFLLACGLAQAATPAHVRLRLGDQTTIHVGQIADLRLGTGHPYSVVLEGDAIVPINESRRGTAHSYRAVKPGTASLLITPTDGKAGDCVDCVTRHCFLTVVP